MTVDASSSRQGGPAETEASLRKTLRGQIEAARVELEAHLAALRSSSGDNSLIAQGESQLGALAALQGQVDSANPMALAMMSAQIAASIAAANTLTQQVQAASTTAQAAVAAEQLAVASKATGREVTALAHDIFERRIFDGDLHFNSDEDKEAYRRNEIEREAYIRAQLAKGTPEGKLNAAAATVGQLNDAEAHGAGANSEFQATKAKAVKVFGDMRAAMEAAGRSTEEADKLAAGVANASVSAPPSKLPAEVAADVDGIAAAMRAAGLSTTPPDTTGHGVTNQIAAAQQPQVR